MIGNIMLSIAILFVSTREWVPFFLRFGLTVYFLHLLIKILKAAEVDSNYIIELSKMPEAKYILSLCVIVAVYFIVKGAILRMFGLARES